MKKLIFICMLVWSGWSSAQEFTSFEGTNDKWGFQDFYGNVVIEAIFDRAGDFSQGRAAVMVNDAIGFIDTTGKFIIPCKYSWSSGFSGGFAIVKLNSKYGFVDLKGNEITPIHFDYVFPFRNGYSIVNQGGTYTEKGFLGGKYGVIDTNGILVVNPRYDFIDSYQLLMFQGKMQPLAQVTRATRVLVGNDNFLSLLNCQVGYLDSNGKEVIPIKYGELAFSEGGLIWGMKEGKWGLLNQSGKATTPFKYDYLPASRTELYGADTVLLIHVEVDSKFGFINREGREVITPIYEDYLSFSEGLIAMKRNGKWGFLNQEGNIVIPIMYDQVKSFEGGYAVVQLAGEEFQIDSDGKRQN